MIYSTQKMICSTRLIPFLSHQQCFRVLVPTRPMSVFLKLARTQPQLRLFNQEKHKIVYDLPTIKHSAGLLRVRYTFPMLSVLCAPLALFFEKSWSTYACLGSLGLLNVGVLFVLTKFLTDTVGKVYVNKEGDIEEVIIGAINRSGRRQDYKFSPNELCILDPITKLHEALGASLIQVKDSNKMFKLYLPKSKVCDTEAFTKLFGEKNLNIALKSEK